MRQALITLLAVAPLAFAQSQTFTYTYSGLPIPIYPDDWDTVSVATIIVPRSIMVSKVTATVQVQFNGVGDLNVYLWSAAGTRTKLLERNCGDLQNIDTTFDDSALNRYADFCPAEAGRGPFRSNEPLGNSNDENAFGYWRLGVENNGSEVTGLLNGFSITITGTPVGTPTITENSVVSSTTFKNGTVAPGDLVAIFGVNLGPAEGIRADTAAALPTTLGQTSVMIGDVPASVFYVSDKFVAVHAPLTLTPGSEARVQVTTGSGASSSVPLSVVAAKPGVFTYDAVGGGQAKAINQDGSMNGDGSINSAHTAAAPGSIIQVFATGLGLVDPAIPQGTPAPTSTISTVISPVSATVDGKPATVVFAGAAPGLIGTYQVNIMIPPETRSGAARLVLTAEGNTSQDGVTVEVR